MDIDWDFAVEGFPEISGSYTATDQFHTLLPAGF
jgi:hypothetical protein